jgi:transposase-like protein/IS1 family transposase
MNPQEQFCPNMACHASGRVGGGNIVIHSQKERRYRCRCCGKTFSETYGTSVYRLKKTHDLFVLVVTLLVYGCPVQAIVAAFGLDERTVRDWLGKAGRHAQSVHEQMVGEQRLDLQQVQADEIRVKTQCGVLWLAMALMVSTRLWLGGVVSARRDMQLAQRLAAQIRRVAQAGALLLAVDGWPSYVRAFRLAFRTPVRTGTRGRPRLVAWEQLVVTQVVKRHQGRMLSIERRIVQGTQLLLTQLLIRSQGGGVINTAYIERLNATFRQRLSCLARRTRALARTAPTVEAAMFLLGCVYNFCTVHMSLSLTLPTTPAMAAHLTDHLWSIQEVLLFKVPTSYQPLKRRGRPRKIVCSCGFV